MKQDMNKYKGRVITFAIAFIVVVAFASLIMFEPETVGNVVSEETGVTQGISFGIIILVGMAAFIMGVLIGNVFKKE